MKTERACLGPDGSIVIPAAVQESLQIVAGEEVEFCPGPDGWRLRKAERPAAEPLIREVEMTELGLFWRPVELLAYPEGWRALCREPALSAEGKTRAEAIARLKELAQTLGQ